MVKKKKPTSGSGQDKDEVVNKERNKIYSSSSNRSRDKEVPAVVPESSGFDPVVEILQSSGILVNFRSEYR